MNETGLETFSRLLVELKHEVRDLRDHLALRNRIEQMEVRIMSAISEFATRQESFNARIDSAVQGIADDVAGLKEDIRKLQDSAGQITPEDQALLDAIDARASGIADKVEALDALTPPKPPVV